MRELFLKKGIWLSVLIGFVVFVLGIPFAEVKPPMAAGNFLTFYQRALQSKMSVFFIPVLASFPTGAVYVQEKSSGFLKLYSIRISRMEYIKKKLVPSYISGFLPFFWAGLLAFFACFLFLYPLERIGRIDGKEVWDCFFLLIRICAVGGILAELSSSFAALFQSYYMAYGLAFVCYYLLIILKERYLPELYAMYPVEWILCEENWGSDGSGIWIFFLAFTMAAVLLHGLLLYERIRELI